MLNLDKYERAAIEAIRAAAEGAATVQYVDEIVPRPSRAAIEAMTDADLVETRAMFAETTTGRDLLRRQGWSDGDIAELVAKHKTSQATQALPAPPALATKPPVAIATPIAARLTSASAPAVANTAVAWRAEFEQSVELQREFGAADLYCTYRQGVADGRIGPVRGGVVIKSPGVSMLRRAF